MYQIDIQKLDHKYMITEGETEAAVFTYLWDIVQNVPVEDYLKDADKDENVSITLSYLRLASFVPFFLRASDIVWDFDDGGDRTYSFNDNLRQLVIDDEVIKPYTLNVIKNCLQNQGLINLSDFDAPIDDEYFYNDEKWSFFKDLADCFSSQKYLKSLHINDLTVLFSSITDTEEAQNLANHLFSPIDDEAPVGFDDENADEDYVHEFDSQDEFVEFVMKHSDELFPKDPTSIQCHLYSFLNGDCD